MKTKQLSKVLLPVILALVLAISGFAMIFAVKGNASANVSDAIASFEDEYKTGAEITIPDAYFTDGGNQIKARKIVYYPDGTLYSVSKFTPTIMGNYTIEYSATTSSGDYLSETKEIYAYSELYEVAGKGSSVEYGAHEMAPNTNGIKVQLTSAGEFKYNKVIDIKSLNGKKPVISMFMTPDKIGEADGQQFTVKLTDIYDPSNYVEMHCTGTQDASKYVHNITYFRANAAFQPESGMEWGFNKMHTNNIYGYPSLFSFFGCDKKGQASEAFSTATGGGLLNLYLDLSSKKVSVYPSGTGQEIIDLDNPAHFADPWTGFTTGEVFLSITVKGLDKKTMGFVITDIAGENLQGGKFVDNGAPFVTVDTQGYDANNLPKAVINQAYPVFESTAVDPYSGNLETNVKVYQNYGSPSQSTVNVVNGKFIPRAIGNYYIVYSATDYSGNRGEQIHVVTCEKTGTPVSLEVATEGRVTASNVGEEITLPVATATGGNGAITITPTVKDSAGNELEIKKGGIFQPTAAGEYTVEFVAQDFVSTTDTYSYTLTVSLSNKPVFEKDAVLSKYYLAGYEYIIPMISAYDFSNGKTPADVTIKVIDDAGERTLNADRKATFTVTEVGATKTCTIKYITSNANGTTERSYPVTVINPKKMVGANQRLDVGKYFITNGGVSVVLDDDYSNIKATANGGFEFVNPLIAPNFTMNFFTSGAASTVGKIRITLADSVDESKKIELELQKNKNGKTDVVLNGGSSMEIDINYNVGEYTLGYDGVFYKFSFDGVNYTTIPTYEDGTAFAGFPSGKLRLYVDMENITGTATLKIKSINNQQLNGKTILDRVAPRVSVPTTDTRIKDRGDIITVPSAIAGDVLDPEVPLTVRVTDPNGVVVADVNGVPIDKLPADREYQVKLEVYGQYRITYSTEDDAGNPAGMPILYTVSDREKPVIKLSYTNATTAKKGSTVVLASFSATDNKTPADKIVTCCLVVRPTGSIFTVNMKDSNSFVANEVGTYILRYMAIDDTGNATVIDYKLTVTA